MCVCIYIYISSAAARRNARSGACEVPAIPKGAPEGGLVQGVRVKVRGHGGMIMGAGQR